MNYWDNDDNTTADNTNSDTATQDTKNDAVNVELHSESNRNDDYSTYTDEETEKQALWREYKPKEKKKRPVSGMTKFVVALMIISLVGGSAFGISTQWAKQYFKTEAEPLTYSYYTPESSADNMSNVGTLTSYADVVDSVKGSIVSITLTETYRDIFNNQQVANGSGSGVIFNTENGILIMTNEHVVSGVENLYASFDGEDLYPASIVGVDKDADVAVIKVERNDLPKEVLDKIVPARLGTSSSLRMGDLAIVIGNPLGYSHSTTAGVISGVNRVLEDKNSLPLIQTDAPINPGNSGGALVNINGEVIGLNTIKISDTEVEGIGFAIPIDDVKPIINEILEKGYVSKPYMGITGTNVTERASELYELPIGVYVTEVLEGSPAAEAGLKVEDVIVAFNGVEIVDFNDLVTEIAKYKPGETITLKVVRNEETINMNLTMGDKNNR